MSRRPPFWPTLVVALAVAAMVALGLWQLQRRGEKEAAIARYAANAALPPRALAGPANEAMLFRRVSARCLRPVAWRAESGRSASGEAGWRHIASCRTGAEGPGFAADMGESNNPAAPAWTGGEVRGRLTWAPQARPLIARLIGRAAVAPTPMIVAETPAPGLAPSAQPDPAAVPNNHLAYAVQWFLFAGVAVVIYVVALRRRARG